MKAFLFIAIVFFTSSLISGQYFMGNRYARSWALARDPDWYARARRTQHAPLKVLDPLEDCNPVTVDEGRIYYKSPTDEPLVCGIFLVAEPDKRIQVTFLYLDVPCENGGLVSWVDGWEMNGQVWPADDWDDNRVAEFCGSRPSFKLTSRQNAALIQYRVPARSKGFAIHVRHVANPKPCNILGLGVDQVYNLRSNSNNNCSIINIAPSQVQVLDIDVGVVRKGMKKGFVAETGIYNHCKKHGLSDYVEIGGTFGLDHTSMEHATDVCGSDSQIATRSYYVMCEVTVVNLVSSGLFENSVTVALSGPPSGHAYADLLCGMHLAALPTR